MNSSPRAVFGRRAFLGGGALSVAGLALAGCSFDRGASGGSTGGAGPDFITVNVTGPASQFYQNWNPWTPSNQRAGGAGYFYEPLLRLNRYEAFKPYPWLAESWEWNENFTEVVFTLRTDVTWADGETFNADDVVYTLNAPSELEGETLILPNYGFEQAEKVDDFTVRVSWAETFPNGLYNISLINIVPQHIFETQDFATWTNPEPIGTGPWSMGEFQPQQIRFTRREGYWNGPLPMREVRMRTYSNPDAGQAMVLAGELDLATMSWQDASTSLTNRDNNTYTVWPTGGPAIIMFNCEQGFTADVAVRKALSKVVDFAQVLSLYDVGTGVSNVTGLSEEVWGDYIAPEFQGVPVTQDLEAATRLLQDAGWSVENGQFVKDGQSYPVALKVVAEYVNWVTWSEGLKQQLLDGLGIELQILKIPETQHFDQQQKGEFDLIMTFGGGGSSMYSMYGATGAGMLQENLAPIGEIALGNHMRLEDSEMGELLLALATELDVERVKAIGMDVQRRFVELAPFLPVSFSANYIEMSGRNWSGVPEAVNGAPYLGVPYGNNGTSADTTLFYQNLKPVTNS